ncbi:hypothetical protein [Candidatus Uabimicrobium amorphum]|uniref:Uncharacterized protein n=1 Tax=Uabimicrobium amorphum TaxID=2596890 RepID=A0A5S9INR1_UABAM|nr:hypothetical protein [Candidatus Uabimicrobium amorphum]BBM84420.1 hypothetical protein UABAM_02780 [Candidatus Uabimicrobium amorphum]
MSKNFVFAVVTILTLSCIHCETLLDINQEYSNLEKEYYLLRDIAMTGDWLVVDKRLKEMDYKQRIEKWLSLDCLAKFDPQDDKRKQVEKWLSDLNIWLKYIEEYKNPCCEGLGCITTKITEMLNRSSRTNRKIEKLFYKGRKTSNEYILKDAISNIDMSIPDLQKFIEVAEQNKKYPLLHKLGKQAKRQVKKYLSLRKKIKVELEIIDRLKEIQFNGVICISDPKKKQQNVVFIGNNIFRVNDKLKSGFTVKEVRNGEVVLEYKRRYFVLCKKRNGRK